MVVRTTSRSTSATFKEHVILAKEQHEATPDRQIVFTFGDGHVGNRHAARLLREVDRRGVFFVISRRIGSPTYLSWDDLRDMIGMGHGIGSHSATHSILTEIDDETCMRELVVSRNDIERKTGAACTSFAFPGGVFHQRHIVLAKEAGYRNVFSSIEGHPSPKDYYFRFQARRSTYGHVNEIFALKPSYTLRRHARSRLSLLSSRAKTMMRSL